MLMEARHARMAVRFGRAFYIVVCSTMAKPVLGGNEVPSTASHLLE